MKECKRVYAVDLARGLAVLFMVWVHALETYGTKTVIDSGFGFVIDFLGSPPAAPVFMAAMGISFYYSRNTGLKHCAVRGGKIILLGYVLNILRNVGPVFVASIFSVNTYAALPESMKNYSEIFFEIDILQFAGLAYMMMALLHRLNINKYLLLFLAAVLAFVSPGLWGRVSPSPLANFFLDYLWGDKPSSLLILGNLVSFPFFPWFAYVLLGMFLGETLHNAKDLSKVFNWLGLVGGAVCLAGLIAILPNFEYHINDYYHSRPLFVLFASGFVCFWLYLCHLLVTKTRPTIINDVLYYWSKNVTVYYIVQWVLIMVGAIFVTGFNSCSYITTILVMLLMTVLSHYVTRLYVRLKN